MADDVDDLAGNLHQRIAGAADEFGAGRNLSDGIVDELADFLGGARRSLRQFPHLLRHDSKALAGLTRSCRLDSRV